jgi:DNA-binding XRE family transcriptional regulator
MVSTRQIKAARALLRWSQEELATRSGVSYPTIARLESSDGDMGGRADTSAKIVAALEGNGVMFTNGGQPGVKMKIYADPAQRATLVHGDRKVPCYTLGEAVLAWQRLSPDDQKTATITLASGLSYGADEIDRLHRPLKPPA